MSGLEAAGDVITGAVVARGIEPAAGEGAAAMSNDGHGHCLNCRARLHGSHCHACGQAAHVHRTLGAIGHEIAHGVFHFEGKIWRTLPMLVLHPGELTRRYVHGERARFVSPLALFLFCVFLTFAVAGSIGSSISFVKGMQDGWVSVPTKTVESLATARKQMTVLRQERATALAQARATTNVDRRIGKLGDDITYLEAEVAKVERLANGKFDDIKVHSAIPGLDVRLRHALENPGLMIYKLQSSAYKYAWR